MTDDIDAFLSELSNARPQSYTAMERYADFRAVFLGSDQGKRVLHEILSWGHLYRSSAQVANFDPYKTMYCDGQRSIGIKTMMVINNEPRSQPTKATTQPIGD